MRTPTEIAAELAALRDKANLAFVPVNVVAAVDLMVEFAASTAAALDAAGITKPATVEPEQPQG